MTDVPHPHWVVRARLAHDRLAAEQEGDDD
jgi:hypothetical protein